MNASSAIIIANELINTNSDQTEWRVRDIQDAAERVGISRNDD